MNWKNRLTNYNFWISMFSAVLLVLQALKIEFDIAYVNEIFTAVLGLLVVIGIISDPTRTTMKSGETTSTSNLEKKENAEDQEHEEKFEEKIEKKEAVKEIIPTEQKNETNDVTSENDIQTILAKLSIGLEEKMKELSQTNFENMNKMVKTQNGIRIEEEKNEEIQKDQTSIQSPAVAEIGNPFIDVIN